ncbi:MAG: DUF4179 domain-containing protein [Eubacteriales bacterium]|nr:DUF4179 domain-containing protein [Eubacteriales bacterium]
MKHYMNDYIYAMDQLQLSQQQQERLFHAAVHQANHANTKRRPIRRTALAAVVLVSLLAITACGIVLKTAGEAFAPVFGNTTSQKAVMDDIGTQIGASATDNGVTITADAVIGDDKQAWIMYTLSWDDSADIDLPEGIVQSPTDYATEIPETTLQFKICDDWHWIPYNQFFDSDPNDNAIEFMEVIHLTDNPIEPFDIHSLTRKFQNLQFCGTDAYGNPLGNYMDDSVPSWQTLIEGNWTLEFDASYENAAVSVPLGDQTEIEIDGFVYEIHSIQVSPISVCVSYSDPNDNIEESFGTMLTHHLIYVTTTSGQTYHTDATAYDETLTDDGSKRIVTDGGAFTEVIPLEDIESVTIGTVTYPVPHAVS